METDLPPVVREFARRIHRFFKERLVGVYLGGSYSTGEWTASSDYDVVVILTEEPHGDEIDRLRALHETFAREDPDSLRLEGDYIEQTTLIPEGTAGPAWWFRHGSLRDRLPMMSADNVANLGRDGIAVFGPPPSSIFPAVEPDQVRNAVREMMAEEPDASSERAAAREIIDLARSLRALETGEPTSRKAGLAWGLRSMDRRWREALRRAGEVSGGAATVEDDQMLRNALSELRESLGLR